MNKILTNIVFVLLCAVLVFAALARGGVQGWAVTVIHMLTLAAAIVLLMQKTLDWDWKRVVTPLDLLIVLLLLLASVSTYFSTLRPASVKALLLLLNYAAVYYLVTYTVRKRRQQYVFAGLIICQGFFLATFGLLKLAGLQIFPWFHYRDLPDFGALTATYGNPNHMAGFFEMAIPLGLGLLLADDSPKRNITYAPVIFLMGIGLVLTMSRGGWSCAMLGLIFLAAALLFKRDFPRRRTGIALTGSGIVLVLVMLSSYPAVRELLTVPEVIDQAGGLDGRLQVTKAVIAMIQDRPLLGFGPGTFAYSFLQYQPPGIQGWYTMAHNDYAHFTAELGILLPLFMIWMMIALFRHGFRKMKSPDLITRGISLGSMAGIFAILCHSFIDFNLHIPANALFFTILCALVAGPSATEEKD
ncbi:O-antigen ligase family protein [Thermodesulfobacteriota bacterium]